MIQMKNWQVSLSGLDRSLDYSGGWRSHKLEIYSSDAPDSWTYQLELLFDNGRRHFQRLHQEDNLLWCELRREELEDGLCQARVCASGGAQHKHSGFFDLAVEGTGCLPCAPYAHTPGHKLRELEQRMHALHRDTAALTEKMPLPLDGTWWIYDARRGGYVDSGAPAHGGAGPQGLTGPQGAQGVPGPQGVPGEKGEKGERGETGPQGEKGERGEKGETGERGPRGETGPQGVQGERGLTGLQGSKGDRGETGPQGEQGPQGEPGRDFRVLDYYPSVTALSAVVTAPEPGDAYGVGASAPYHIYIFSETQGWVDNGTIQGPAGPQGEKGDRGETGPQGDKGDTGAPGEKGDRGDPFTYEDFTEEQLEALRGPQGEKGETGAQGAQGEKGDPFTYEDFTGTQLSLLKGPKGDKGDKGDKGEDGADGRAATSILKLTIPASSWAAADENDLGVAAEIHVSAPGVSGDESRQVIHVAPALNSFFDYVKAGAYCVGHTEDTLGFFCTEIPEVDLEIYASITEVL